MIGGVAVRGGGAVAFAAAIAIKRAAPRWRVSVTLDGSATDQQPGGADATIAAFHARVGFPHALFCRKAAATPVVGALFSNWGQGDFTVPEQARERFADGVAVHQLWLRREAAGAPPLDWLLAEAGAPPSWRFDAAAYADLLRRMASQIGVATADAAAGDLVVRCAPSARRTDAWDDWSAHLPTLRSSPLKGSGVAPGWIEHVVRVGDAIELSSSAGAVRLTPGADAAGRGRRPWVGGEVAIGPAAIDLPPLFGLPLSAALADVLRLVQFLPQSDDADVLAAEYNRRTAMVHEALLDFAGAPFSTGPNASRTPSPGLSAVLTHFTRRGRVPVREGDPIGRGRWIALLAGLGLRPERIDPSARTPDDLTADRLLSAIASSPPR